MLDLRLWGFDMVDEDYGSIPSISSARIFSLSLFVSNLNMGGVLGAMDHGGCREGQVLLSPRLSAGPNGCPSRVAVSREPGSIQC